MKNLDGIFTFTPIILVFALIVLIFIWIIIPYLIAKAARERGRSFFGFFILCILFTPLVGGLILALMGKNTEQISKDNLKYGITKICPYCANEINFNAKICMFCKKELLEKEVIDKTLEIKNDFNNPYIVLSEAIIRSIPDINAVEIGELTKNDVVDFLSEANEDININDVWYKIKFENLEGWCLRSCLRKYE